MNYIYWTVCFQNITLNVSNTFITNQIKMTHIYSIGFLLISSSSFYCSYSCSLCSLSLSLFIISLDLSLLLPLGVIFIGSMLNYPGRILRETFLLSDQSQWSIILICICYRIERVLNNNCAWEC